MAADFGIGLDFGIPDGADRAQHYRRILEMLPSEFTTAWISDHLQFGDRPQLEGWTTLTHLAAEYPRYRFGHLVLGQGFRNPALLAKMSATRCLKHSVEKNVLSLFRITAKASCPHLIAFEKNALVAAK